MPAHNRVYLADKDFHIYGYSLSLSVVEYQTAVLRGDMDAAAEILPSLPRDQLNKVARFLESKGSSHLPLPTISLIPYTFRQTSKNSPSR
jgi:coatomer subunit beta'